MATPNIVPRADSEGALGTATKYWGAAYIDLIYVGAGKIGRDADNNIDFSTDNTTSFVVNGNSELKLDASQLYPTTSDGLTLGHSSYHWSDLFLASGAVINFADGDIALTHSSNVLEFTGGLMRFVDGQKLTFGSSNDLELTHDGTNSWITNATGDLKIYNNADNGDIIFATDNGSGGVTEYLKLDGGYSTPQVIIPDNAALVVGSGLDFNIIHNGSNTSLTNNTGNLTISNRTNDSDIIFQSEDGSGGVTTYFTVDGSARDVVFAKDIVLNDNVGLKVGTSGDLTLSHDATNSHISNSTGDLKITQNANDKDIVFNCDNGAGGNTAYFYLDGSSATHNGSATTALFTNWPDNSRISLGTGHDMRLFHDGTQSIIDNFTGDLFIRNFADDKDIIFQCDDGSGGVTEYFRLDGSHGGNPITTFPDNSSLNFGSTFGDLTISHDGFNSTIKNGTGALTIRQSVDDGDLVLQCDDGSGGTTAYITLDGGLGYTVVNKTFLLNDNVQLSVGTSEHGINMVHDGSNSTISNAIGNLTIQNFQNDGDIIFKSDDGSGSEAEYFRLDGANTEIRVSKKLQLSDNVILALGNGEDLQLYHNGTNSTIDSYTGNLQIVNRQDDGDITFSSDDGSGGTTAYLTLDGGVKKTIFSQHALFSDGIEAHFGTGVDLKIYHSGTNSFIENQTGSLTIRNNTDDGDITFQSDDGSGGVETYFLLDGSQGATVFPDNKILGIGTGADLQIRHSGTDGQIKEHTGNLNIINSADDKDITFQSDDGSGGVTAYLTIDGSVAETKFNKSALAVDNIFLGVGNGSDLYMVHDGTNSSILNTTGNLTIQQNTDDGDIIFRCDDGSGGTTAYLTLDGSAARTVFSRETQHSDNVKGKFGSSGDLEIYHDGSNSYIKDAGTGNLNILATHLQLQNAAANKFYATFVDGGATSIFHNGGLALTTTATGVQVSGATGTAEGGGIDASDAVSITVGEINGEIITTVFVDIGAGSIVSGSDAGDVIGNEGVAAAFITKLTTAINGLVYRGEMICLEVPTTGDPDINLTCNSSGTIAEDISGEAGSSVVLVNGGVATLAAKNDVTIPSGGIQDNFIYLTHGGTTAGTYDAGKFLIKFYGAKVTGI